MWPHLLDRSKELGLTGVASYVFWNYHETSRDVYDFTGERDLGHFLDLSKEREPPGLFALRSLLLRGVELRRFSALPARRTRHHPAHLQASLSTSIAWRKFFMRLAEQVNPHLATRGGPVVLIQVENEYANVAARYGPGGQEYLQWMADLAKRIGFADVPTTMCEGASEGPIATLNGSEIIAAAHRSGPRQRPARSAAVDRALPGLVPGLGRDQPDPAGPRSAPLALAILVFLANGGAGFNYYMGHGGTNFARNSMYLQTTATTSTRRWTPMGA